MEVGEIIHLTLHCHHQNDSCIKMGSDESHFNVSVGSDGQSHRTVSTNHNQIRESTTLLYQIFQRPKMFTSFWGCKRHQTARQDSLVFIVQRQLVHVTSTDAMATLKYRFSENNHLIAVTGMS